MQEHCLEPGLLTLPLCIQSIYIHTHTHTQRDLHAHTWIHISWADKAVSLQLQPSKCTLANTIPPTWDNNCSRDSVAHGNRLGAFHVNWTSSLSSPSRTLPTLSRAMVQPRSVCSPMSPVETDCSPLCCLDTVWNLIILNYLLNTASMHGVSMENWQTLIFKSIWLLRQKDTLKNLTTQLQS